MVGVRQLIVVITGSALMMSVVDGKGIQREKAGLTVMTI